MLLITKIGHRIVPIRMGAPDEPTFTCIIRGIDIDSSERDLFGKRVVEEFVISDIAGFQGSYAFPPINLKDYDK